MKLASDPAVRPGNILGDKISFSGETILISSISRGAFQAEQKNTSANLLGSSNELLKDLLDYYKDLKDPRVREFVGWMKQYSKTLEQDFERALANTDPKTKWNVPEPMTSAQKRELFAYYCGQRYANFLANGSMQEPGNNPYTFDTTQGDHYNFQNQSFKFGSRLVDGASANEREICVITAINIGMHEGTHGANGSQNKPGHFDEQQTSYVQLRHGLPINAADINQIPGDPLYYIAGGNRNPISILNNLDRARAVSFLTREYFDHIMGPWRSNKPFPEAKNQAEVSNGSFGDFLSYALSEKDQAKIFNDIKEGLSKYLRPEEVKKFEKALKKLVEQLHSLSAEDQEAVMDYLENSNHQVGGRGEEVIYNMLRDFFTALGKPTVKPLVGRIGVEKPQGLPAVRIGVE